MDLGCGPDKIKPDALGVDGRALPGVDFVTTDIYNLPELLKDKRESFDAVFSSHFLEHLPNDELALRQWAWFVKSGGHLVVYLPDDDHYDNDSNPEHLQRYCYADFVARMGNAFDNLRLVDHGPDVGPDRYSFFVVWQKV